MAAATAHLGAEAAEGPGRLRVAGRHFLIPGDSRFAWRGLTSFRLLEMLARGRTTEVEALLDWAAGRRLTVVRVLAMADVLFKLSPAEGRTQLPRLLRLAAARGLYAEVVALADTRRVRVDLDEQVRAIGRICSGHDNSLVEIANEPWHPTQRRGLGDAATLRRLRAAVPPGVPVSFGSAERDDSSAYADGDYITTHLQRADGRRGWEHVVRMRAAGTLGERTGKPVVDDEPIGAGEATVPGRRDADAARWRAKGLLARFFDIGATFHYEGGLGSRIPAGVEGGCFEAWREGLEALPRDFEHRFRLSEPAAAGNPVASFDRDAVVALFVAQEPREAWTVAIGVTRDPQLRWAPGWRVAETKDYQAMSLVRGVLTGS